MAEWVEIQALTIAWIFYLEILKQIVAVAKLETQVIILTDNPTATQNYLPAKNAVGLPLNNMDNITLLEGNYDTVWMHDWAANPAWKMKKMTSSWLIGSTIAPLARTIM